MFNYNFVKLNISINIDTVLVTDVSINEIVGRFTLNILFPCGSTITTSFGIKK